MMILYWLFYIFAYMVGMWIVLRYYLCNLWGKRLIGLLIVNGCTFIWQGETVLWGRIIINVIATNVITTSIDVIIVDVDVIIY